MKISLVIATYNRATLLARTLQSVQAQTHTDFEVVVVDDGSTDDTKTVMQSFTSDSRIRYEQLPLNQGSTIARNHGLDVATGDIIIVWDSDDVLYETTLARIQELFLQHPDADIVSAHCRQVRDTAIVPYTPLVSGYVSVEQIVCRILPANTKIRAVRKHVFATVRYEAKNIDFTVNCYLADCGTWYHSDEELGDIYLEFDSESLTSARKVFRPERSILRVDPLQRFLARFGAILQRDLPARYGALSYGLSVGLLLSGKTRNACKAALAAAQYDTGTKHLLWLGFTLLPGSYYLLKIYIAIRGL